MFEIMFNTKYQDMFQYDAGEWLKNVDLNPSHSEIQKRNFKMMKEHLMLIKHDENCCEDFWDVDAQKYTIKGSSMLVLLLMNL